jgi:bifunctional DNA-binding transcriptional regulator/antitoxin component of YhaV-PrlF toxin-antitoxin module
VEIREQLGLVPGSIVEFSVENDGVRITKVAGREGRGKTLVARLRGRATSDLTTDEIMALTRG